MNETWQANNVGSLHAAVARAEFLIKEHGFISIVFHIGEVRSSEQNRKLWPMLADIARQVIWHGNKLVEEEYKDMFTAEMQGQKVIPSIDGRGFVRVGGRTSKLKKKEFIDLIEIMYAFGSEHDVKWSEPALKVYEQYATGG